MSKELDDAYFRSNQCTYYEPLLSKLVDCVDLLEERIKGLLGAKVYVGDTDTLPAGSEATVSASKHGYDTMLDFGIPKGDKGDPGEPGAPGAPGSDANVTKENVEAALGYEPLNAEYANNIYIMQKQIENLQGISATEETDSTEAYTKTVPTGAQKWASLDKVGGKTVVWNKLVPKTVARSDTQSGLTVMIDDNNVRFHVIGTPAALNTNVIGFPYDEDVIAGHEYMVVESKLLSGTSTTVKTSITGKSTAFGGYDFSPIGSAAIRTARDSKKVGVNLQFVFSDTTTAVDAWYEYPTIVDLTQMFGAGNEPTSLDEPRIAFIKAYAEQHPEYNPGELMSAEVVEVESKGTFPIPAEVRDMCPGYGVSGNYIDFAGRKYVQTSEIRGGAVVQLATPIEVDLSDVLTDDNFIEVEAGGTVTFKQASTQLPVPSSVTYQISTSEVIANA